MTLLRLLRRTRWLLFRQRRTLTGWSYESCQHCGRGFRVMWQVEDPYWMAVTGETDEGGGSYCLDCFLELAEVQDIHIPRDAFQIEILKPSEDV